jgi:hypothetical protein
MAGRSLTIRRVRVKLGALVLVGIAAIAVPVAAQDTGATIKGTKGPDVLKGTSNAETLNGKRGNDKLRARGGDDTLRGSGGKDNLKASKGSDEAYGGKGRDTLNGGAGFDLLYGESGPDVIRARDNEPDEIDCGDGNDKAIVDLEEDGVFDCETLAEPEGGMVGVPTAP